MNAPSLFDVEPTQGHARSTDDQPSVTAAERAPARTQRRVIASVLLCRGWVTADWLADNDHTTQSHRSVWSTRLGGLVRDGYLRKRGTVAGPSQQVTAYELTDDGRRWALDLTREVAA